ncbi:MULTISPECIES: hypothetical protein [unclassified Sphingomonas]|uniref:DUF7697 family protein n=1 Tax=unclassified Sphingomonas TaxID=196159 RepID=UPI00286AA479|nr:MULTISPECIES: hypothetical protein [unclassified Sphingomonas]
MSRPVGLDFGAVMALGAGRGVDQALLAEILPRIEGAIVHPDDGMGDEEEGEPGDDDP